MEADSLVKNAFRVALAALDGEGVVGADVRERKHLDPMVKKAFRQLVPGPVVSKTLTTDRFSGLGPVDVVVADPLMFIELKWSYNEKRSKIFESLWDAIKLAILAGEHEAHAYVATGASESAWSDCESADLFEQEIVDPYELWERTLTPPGPNGGTTVGEDLILGSPSGGESSRPPANLAIAPVDQIPYRGGYLLKVIRVREMD